MTEHGDSDDAREPVVHPVEMTATVVGTGVITGPESIERGLNEVRLAVLGVLVGIALTVGFGVPCSWLVQVAAGVAAFAVSCALIRWRVSRHHLMAFMHWLTGQ